MRKKVAIHLDMAFDVRQFVSTGIVKQVSKFHEVHLYVRPNMVDSVQMEVGKDIKCRQVHYYEKGNLKPFKKFNKIRVTLHFFLFELFRLTYANLHKKQNRTRKFHISTALSNEKRNGIRPYIFELLAVNFSNLSCKFPIVRWFFRQIRLILATPSEYIKDFKRENFSLAITCSMGIERDIFFMCEAHKEKIPIFVAIQSWDKTSTKGYPVVPVDHVSLWSHIMTEEVNLWHDIEKKKTFVGGVPEWDHYFNDKVHFDRSKELSKLKLDPLRKTIYVALCDSAYHLGNMELIKFLCKCLEQSKYISNTQFIFRAHPSYFQEKSADMCKEFLDFLELFKNKPFVHFDIPNNEKKTAPYAVSNEDRLKVKKLFSISDVCISVLSTQMIEATIFDKPAIAIKYGTWKSFFIEAEMERVDYEHLLRVFNTGGVSIACSDSELLEEINSYIENPDRNNSKRKALLDQEVPENRGTATLKISEKICRIIEGVNT